MRNKKAIQETTSNFVYRRLMASNTRCGWCGMGSGCNKRNRQGHYYYKTFEYRGSIRIKSKYPSWKMMSKYPKQYQKPKLLKEEHKRLTDYFEFSW